ACRKMVFNHTSSALGAWFRVLPYIDEFKPGQRIAKEWRQHLARWMTQGVEPDGSMVEIADEGHFAIPMILGFTFNQLDKDKPDWYTPGFRNRAMEYFDNVYKYLFRHPAPGGYQHRMGRRDYGYQRLVDLVNPAEKFLDRSKEIYSEPEIRRILDALCDVSSGKLQIDPKLPWQQKRLLEPRQAAYDAAVKILGDEKPGAPKINSDWMPYTGSYYFRGGWDRYAPFMAMLARGSKGGSYLEPGSYGQLYNYDYNFPLTRINPITIDNYRQNPIYPAKTYMPGSKTSSLTYAQQYPSPFRWHSSDSFDYGEAIYEGAYQNLPVKYPLNSYPEVDFGQPAIEDVRSDRRVIFLRGERLFIYVDAIHYKNPEQRNKVHNYTEPLTIMQINSKNKPAFDEANKTVSTANTETPNGMIRQFFNIPVQYKIGRDGKPDDDYISRLGANFEVIPQDVNASWNINGDFAIVSLLSSADKGVKDPVIENKALNCGQDISGFTATLADGAKIWCQSAVDGSKNLSCEMFNADAETVVVVKNKTGKISGMALGCKKLSVNGQPVEVTHPDFEFAAAKVAQKIYTPVSPVEFSPPANVFTDTTTVEMKSKTPGVEIRYTTDGSSPTRKSKLYAGPITIRESTE
ncbi:MAG: chitobiase/beta-hexosaminidase C-terminal domain-containing protein, partial [Lentisphaerota bacterium]